MAQEARLREREAARAAEHAPPAMLAPFVRYLEEAGLMRLHVRDEGPIGEVDHEAADNAIRLQALVMLGNRFDLGAPYECSGYSFGPVSEPLAGDAQDLESNRAAMYDGAKAAVPGAFRREEFERLVMGRDTDWLITASMLADMRAYRDTREELMDTVIDDYDVPGHTPRYPYEYVSGVLDELERAGLITAYP